MSLRDIDRHDVTKNSHMIPEYVFNMMDEWKQNTSIEFLMKCCEELDRFRDILYFVHEKALEVIEMINERDGISNNLDEESFVIRDEDKNISSGGDMTSDENSGI